MSVKIILPGEGFVALTTLVWFLFIFFKENPKRAFFNLMFCDHKKKVVFKLHFFGGRGVKNLHYSIDILPSVYPEVLVKGTFLCEGFVTLTTLVQFLSSVCPDVSVQITFT